MSKPDPHWVMLQMVKRALAQVEMRRRVKEGQEVIEWPKPPWVPKDETPQQARLRVQLSKSEEQLLKQVELAAERKKYWEWKRRRKDG